ncbi:non-canonical purine NTP pyrophosphatase [Helicobacter anatolicus]|uniref:non-canonical purine NTP pyrophosphatase n=1 Tax=Helicobacter anatolicus TaxID=2905874 RepID=UPI001E2DA7CF|nr:non-canonical purine NTP pyrophosphatase [Helicobacter anatolicus]
MEKIKIIVASSNVGKIREICAMLGENYEVISKKEAGVDVKIIEDAPDFMGNALLKAKGIFAALKQEGNILVLSDDSGLCVDCLDGEPGVYSARYAKWHDDTTENAEDSDNRLYLQKRLHEVGSKQSSARFVASMVLYGKINNQIICLQAQGECEGIVFDNEKGEGGFGYDSMFMPLGYDKRMAELDITIKNAISHRFNALKQLIIQLEKVLHG